MAYLRGAFTFVIELSFLVRASTFARLLFMLWNGGRGGGPIFAEKLPVLADEKGSTFAKGLSFLLRSFDICQEAYLKGDSHYCQRASTFSREASISRGGFLICWEASIFVGRLPCLLQVFHICLEASILETFFMGYSDDQICEEVGSFLLVLEGVL